MCNDIFYIHLRKLLYNTYTLTKLCIRNIYTLLVVNLSYIKYTILSFNFLHKIQNNNVVQNMHILDRKQTVKR